MSVRLQNSLERTLRAGRHWVRILVVIFGFACSAIHHGTGGETDYAVLRSRMVEKQLMARNISDTRVLAAMTRVPRHELVPIDQRARAYEDTPLPIGFGQTISQPYIVGLMTQVVDPREDEKVLEIGTGSGYQAAVLSELCKHVFSIEIVTELAENAARDLRRLGFDNVTVRAGDGYSGWPEEAPFNVIMITAAAEEVPAPLLEQLASGGRLIMPVGKAGDVQELTLIRKDGNQLERRRITPVRFVPLTGTARRKSQLRRPL